MQGGQLNWPISAGLEWDQQTKNFTNLFTVLLDIVGYDQYIQAKLMLTELIKKLMTYYEAEGEKISWINTVNW